MSALVRTGGIKRRAREGPAAPDRGATRSRREKAVPLPARGGTWGWDAKEARGHGWQRFGLRARVTAAFAAGAALLSVALALVTFALADHYLLARQVQDAVHQTYADARVVHRDLLRGGRDLGDVLSSLTQPQGTAAYVLADKEWYSGAFAFGYGPRIARPAGLRHTLVRVVESGQPARQRVMVGNEPAVTVGVPLQAVGADFFEVYSLTQLSRTLDLLGWVLFGCAAATSLGGLVLGRWASGRLVRPLRHVADVAGAIAGGELGRRLPAGGGRELAVVSASFNEMVGALEERIRRDAQFASDVSHELRSPLTTIQASLDLLQGREAELSPDSRRALWLLSAEVGRFSNMVQDLLEMSRYDAGAARLDLEEFALDEFVEGTVSAYSSHHEPADGYGDEPAEQPIAVPALPAASTPVPVYVAPEARGLRVIADRRRLQRVMANLLDNALEHAGGAVAVRVERRGVGAETPGPEVGSSQVGSSQVGSSQVGSSQVAGVQAGNHQTGEALVTVEDAGPGIRTNERSAIFERFYRGAAAGRRGATTGTGLGLALVAEHVKAHGGTVEVTDRPGGGSRFVVRIPLAQAPAGQRHPNLGAPRGLPANATVGRPP